jgi:hypothetical protein
MSYGKSGFGPVKIERDQNDGYRFEYACATCGGTTRTGWISAASQDEARQLADRQVGSNHNLCRGCGKWVCDDCYNMVVFKCRWCAPIGINAEHNTKKYEIGG